MLRAEKIARATQGVTSLAILPETFAMISTGATSSRSPRVGMEKRERFFCCCLHDCCCPGRIRRELPALYICILNNRAKHISRHDFWEGRTPTNYASLLFSLRAVLHRSRDTLSLSGCTNTSNRFLCSLPFLQPFVRSTQLSSWPRAHAVSSKSREIHE